MAKGKSTKREFDWRTYSKPPRLLTDDQEQAFSSGVLAPLLEWTRGSTDARFEIRARQAAIYHRGTLLLRVRGAEAPFLGEIDANVRLPRTDRAGAENLEIWPLSSATEVAAALEELERLRVVSDEEAGAGTLSERGLLHAFATSNDGSEDAQSRYVVADTEFQYGRRRFDFVGMLRAEAVGGAAAFTTPRLVFGQLKGPGRPLSGTSGLVAHGADFAEFTQALGGEHLDRARLELDALVQQKLRLGLLSDELPFRHFAEDDPEYLVVLAGVIIASAECDAPLAEMHDKMVARHHRPELMRFAAIGSPDSPSGEATLWLGTDEALSYREFKQFRKQLRA